MPHFKLTLSYDGTSFVGWQRQAAGVSVQGLIEDALGRLDGAPVVVHGAGRTDAGVHALGQTASVTLTRGVDAATTLRAANAGLPDAVRVLDAVEVSSAFHARFAATSKTYRYRIWNGSVLSPFERAYAWHIPSPALDVEAMTAAALCLDGRHDFAAFQAAGAKTRTSERTVFSSRVEAGPSPLVTYEVRGNGFLRHMVRNIVGSLVEIGRGRFDVDWMGEVLASRSRARAGPTAPALGLFLVRVDYDEPDL